MVENIPLEKAFSLAKIDCNALSDLGKFFYCDNDGNIKIETVYVI